MGTGVTLSTKSPESRALYLVLSALYFIRISKNKVQKYKAQIGAIPVLSYYSANDPLRWTFGQPDLPWLPPKRAKIPCMNKSSALANWTPEQLALGKRWVETWRLAGEDLERIRRKEIRELDTYKTILLLCGSADY